MAKMNSPIRGDRTQKQSLKRIIQKANDKATNANLIIYYSCLETLIEDFGFNEEQVKLFMEKMEERANKSVEILKSLR